MSKWTNDLPDEAGKYWFYGEPNRGSMGCDFGDEAIKITPELYSVDITKTSNSFMLVVDGGFMSKRKFDKSIMKIGWIGYWQKIEHIKLPDDNLRIFG